MPKPELSGPVTVEALRAVFGGDADFQSRQIRVGGGTAAVCWMDGLVSSDAVAETVLRPLTEPGRVPPDAASGDLARLLLEGGAYCASAQERTVCARTAEDLLRGWCAVLTGDGHSVDFEVKSDDKRGVEAPQEEKVIKGSRDAFTETLRTNTSLVRKKLRDPALRVEERPVGTCSQTKTALVYLEGLTNPELVAEARRRLSALRLQGLLNPAMLTEQISDHPHSSFPQLISTERPDKFAMNLLEGRVGILVDGLPLGFLAPGTFAQHLKVPEDLSQHYLVSSVLTVLRYLALLLSLLLPGFYVAAAMYHQELLPIKLMQSIIDSRQSVPFPTAVEVLSMLVAFELLQEAGLRLPSPVGQTISIIGALVVGQSAVEARVVSPVVVIVVALAGTAGYAMPSVDMGAALRLWRFVLVIAAVAAGFFGLVAASMLLLFRLCAMDSFGVSYLTPFTGGGGRRRALTRAPANVYTPGEPALNPGEARK